MSLDAKLISLALKKPELLLEFQQAGVDDEFFIGDYQKVWRYIVRMRTDHDSVPSPDLVAARFKFFDLEASKKRDAPMLLTEIHRRHKWQMFLGALDQASTEADDVDTLDIAIANLQGQMNELAFVGNSRGLVDAFGREAKERMMEDLKERRRGGTIGIPTGLKRMDFVTNGLQHSRMVVIMARPGIGKAQPLDARVMTPDGWSAMGAMEVGSTVLTPKGSTAKVIAIHPQGVKKIFRITTSDGATTEATADHLWFTTTRNERRSGRSGNVRTTEEIARSLRASDGQHWNHYLPLIEPLDPPEPDLPIDPYVLGCLLGDGHVRERQGCIEVLLASADPELVERVNEALPCGDFFQIGETYNHRYRSTDRTGLRQRLKSLGMTRQHSWDKEIPDIYMKASAKSRLRLLQGLLDTDGTPSNQSADFCVTSERLAKQVQEIARSLGGVANITSRQTSFTNKDGNKQLGRVSYRVYLTLPEGEEYFLLERKRKAGEGQKIGRALRTIRSVEYVRDAEAKCITIDDPDQLYVTNDYIVTHNSWLNLLFCASAVMNGKKVVLFPLEMTFEETALRLYTIFSQRMGGSKKVLRNLDLSSGRISPKKIIKFLDALENRFAGSLLVADIGNMADPYTIERVGAEVAMNKPDMFWIDYITLMRFPGGRDTREDIAIRALSNGIKQTAVKNHCVGGASAQVNREAVKTREFLPRVEHIAYGDAIGQDADQVISINRKDAYLYYSLVKNRLGPEIGKTRTQFMVDEGIIADSEDQDDEDED